MVDESYDLAFSLGQACACSLVLRTANLQFASFPLDWIARGSLTVRTELVASRFAGWLEKDDFVYEGTNPMNGLGVFVNKRTGFQHLHDFPDRPIEESFDEVREKFRRREERLCRALDGARRVLCVYISRPAGPDVAPDELVRCRKTLSDAFPNASFDLIHLVCEEGRSFNDRLVREISEGITEIVFDYRDPRRDVMIEDAGRAILELGVKVADPRSEAEKKEFERLKAKKWREKRLKRKMDKYGVSSRAALAVAQVAEVFRRLFGRPSVR
jgi:hypothetical protein